MSRFLSCAFFGLCDVDGVRSRGEENDRVSRTEISPFCSSSGMPNENGILWVILKGKTCRLALIGWYPALKFEDPVTRLTKLSADTSDILSIAAPNNRFTGKSAADLFEQSLVYRSIAVDVNDVVAIFHVPIQNLLKLLHSGPTVFRSDHLVADLDEVS